MKDNIKCEEENIPCVFMFRGGHEYPCKECTRNPKLLDYYKPGSKE